MDKTFTIWLDQQLKRHNITRTKFATLAGVGYQTLHPWRLQNHDPSLATLVKVCAALAKLNGQSFWQTQMEAMQQTMVFNEVCNEQR